ncbi:cation-translocating P-type ATPase [Candidatus Thorarchaeota archaeon]|nr:MAG: cation-translocating P-type ATPase [Candidatus Thorarchaeota archaeon]
MSQVISCDTCGRDHGEQRTDARRKSIVGLFSGVLLALGLLIEYFLRSVTWSYVAFLASALSAGAYIIPKGLQGLMTLRLDMHFLMTAASFGAMIIGAPAEGAAVMFLFFVSLLLEDRAGDRVRHEIQALMELEPPSILVRVDGAEACMDPEFVNPGETLIVKPGTRIGLDGVVSLGSTTANEAPITGESRPVPKSVGDKVYAGTMNNEGYIEVEVTERAKETLLSKIVHLVEEARDRKAPAEQLIARFSRTYTPIMVSLSIIIGLISLVLGATPVQSVYRALTLIVISCPCAFAVSIPVSIVSAITGAARSGVLVKGGSYIEALSLTTTVAFDKTGTLTEGTLSVKDICLHNDHTREQVLAAAAALESRSEHPIGKALMAAKMAEDILTGEVDSFAAVPGRGIKGRIADKPVLVGNRQMLIEGQVELEPPDSHSCGVGTKVYVAEGEEHLGTIIVEDTLRRSTKQAIESLHKMGIETVMLTGDDRDIARDVAAAVGVSDFRAGLLPHQKVEAIEDLKKTGKVVMVGDGVNDAPALAASDVGIALGAASSDVALETADVALIEEDLTRVPALIARARATMSVVKQNVITSIGVKVITGVLAALGILSLWLSIGIGDMGLTFLVVANALRLARRQ